MARQKGGGRRRRAIRDRKAWQPYERGLGDERRRRDRPDGDWRDWPDEEPRRLERDDG